MLTLSHVFYATGAILGGAAVLNLRDRRWLQAAFWAILSVPCEVGDQLLAGNKAGMRWPAQAMGAGGLAPGVPAGRIGARAVVGDRGQVRAREASAGRFGNWRFLPALAIPGIALLLVLGARIDALR